MNMENNIVALDLRVDRNTWQMNYKGYLLSVFIDTPVEDAGLVTGISKFIGIRAFTRMYVAVFYGKNDVTSDFFGPSTVEHGMWTISTFTELLDTMTTFKSVADAKSTEFMSDADMEADAELMNSLDAGLESDLSEKRLQV